MKLHGADSRPISEGIVNALGVFSISHGLGNALVHCGSRFRPKICGLRARTGR